MQRTAALSALRREMAAGEYRIICTYPEALAERVTDPDSMRRETVRVKVGDRLAIGELEELLADSGFTKVDFVYEPGQYSLRGGIFDVFSFSESKPYRLDFFGEEVDSIRRFEISSQLSADRLNEVEIVPNLNGFAGDRISLLAFAGEATYWFFDPDYVLRRVNDLRRKVLGEMEEPAEIDTHLVSRKVLLQDMAGMRLFELRDSLKERPADATVAFRMAPQPKFNKNFELLADDIISNGQRGYKTYILSENRAQLERLENIFYQSGRKEAQINPLPITLHEGFVDHDLKLCFYTDHQIFDRYQRYRINGEIKRDEQMTVAELNQLRMGDYVVHIDHGVGRFGGLVKINENGKVHEAIKLIYKDNDVLFVHVHALHRISRYKSGEGEAPKIYKLGSGAWQKLKTATKKAVKDISRELIALYAKRKASKGFAFSPDTYLQQELEASFMWEDTPDQQTATQAVKRDMESNQPMDRLICGDVGFGKTEVAIRAAFKAATDGKQVAVLVPTTILALQHYRSFVHRLRDFPVKVEYLNRTKSSKETSRILSELAEGRIDILIGTHKILGKQVKFHDLGLLIIDEEQKFGVAAKEKLTQMSVNVDTLTLTATPIPRTLQFSLMGSRDLSVISTPPPNRQPIVTETHVFSEEIVRDAIEAELARGGQVYFVHNRVEDLPTLQGLITRLCPKARVGVGHGKMPAEQLEKLIMDFIYGEFDVLLSTSIVENGIDIPNANTIIVNNAQHFGLSDLHQLRGRVGRSNRKAYCYLLTPAEELLTPDAPPQSHRGVLGPGFGLQHRHAGPRHPRCGQPAGCRAERLHRRHRLRNLPENHERGHRRAACRGAAGSGAERGRAEGRRTDGLHRRRPHRNRRRGGAPRHLRQPAGRASEALPRTRLDEGRGGARGLREPSGRPLRSAAPRRARAAQCRAAALGGHPPGYGACQGEERTDDCAVRRRGEFALLQERRLHGAASPCDPATGPICTQAAQ